MIIGRKDELAILKEAYESEGSSFIAVYGRRRIGKTYLVREAFDYKFTFSHSGVAKGTKKEELAAFESSLKSQGVLIDKKITNWLDAFYYLEGKIESSSEKKKVIFIDELSWVATSRSKEFLAALEFFWNSWTSARKDIVLIVSSSATSWLINNIIHSKGGFYHRLTHKIRLLPFSLKECEEYSLRKNLGLTKKEIVELYMAFGGVPYYWSLIRSGDSPSTSIDHLCFSENGELVDEYNYLYASIFNVPKDYQEIIATIAKKKKGLTRKEIVENSKIVENGALSKKLEELIECGFLREYVPFGKSKNGSLYQLIDNFTLFYFRVMKEGKNEENYYQNSLNQGKLNAYKGLSFELVCLEHVKQIKYALGIPGVVSKEYSFACKVDLEKGIDGHQIDLLIDRNDGVINMVEMKYSSSTYCLDKKESENYQKRISDFIKLSKTRKGVVFTMITPYGIVKNSYSHIVTKSLTLDDLFSI